jgi:two-component system, NarL family, sensor histidine kinase UhpB
LSGVGKAAPAATYTRRCARASSLEAVQTRLTTPRRSLLLRLSLVNSAVLLAVFSFLAFTPATIESPTKHPTGGIVSLLGLALVIGVNLLVIRRTLAPLRRLASTMSEVDPLRPGQRVAIDGQDDEIARLATAFNAMLDRLETERGESLRRILDAQESERLKIARNLHDEIGQRLTALMLQLDAVAADAPPELGALVEEARETARLTVEETGRLARTLRPEVLDQLGLRTALGELAKRIASVSDLEVERRLDRDLPPLAPEVELAIYRVAQESLTNAVRHSGASTITLSLQADDDQVTLLVRDDGRGFAGPLTGDTAGVSGMRERAMLIGAKLAIRSEPGGGTEVRLDVPLEGDRG